VIKLNSTVHDVVTVLKELNTCRVTSKLVLQ